MRFSVQEPLVPGESLSEKLENLERLGYDGIELSGTRLGERVDEVKAALARSSLPASTICGGFRPRLLSPDRDERERSEAEIASMLEVSAEVGVDVGVIMVPMFGAAEVPDLSPWKGVAAIEEELAVGALARLGEVAGRLGQTLLLEPLNRYETHFLNDVNHALELCEQAGSPHVRVLADLFHENIEEASIPDSLRRLGPRLGHVHLADSNRWMPGRGHTDFAPAFAAIAEIGYAGWGALECRVSGDAMADLGAGLAVLRAASVGEVVA